MTREDLINKYGFKEIPHFTIGAILVLDLGRNRELSLGSFGTPNEMMTICEKNENDSRKINDLIVIWNYDYDGYLTEEKLKTLLSFFNIQ